MALPTEEEKLFLEKFRVRVKDALPEEQLNDEYFLLRWIRARENDLDKAEAMLRNAVKWRKENNVDHIFEKKISSYFFENFPRWVRGRDREGRPLYLAAIGKWDLRNVVRDGKSAEYADYTIEGFERILEDMRLSNEERGISKGKPPVTQLTAVFDFEGFAWGQLLNLKAVQEFLALGAMYEAYYPEILHSCYFINCPALISKVMFLLKPILAPKTMNKIKVFGTNKEEWQAALLEIIDSNQLLENFGGSLID